MIDFGMNANGVGDRGSGIARVAGNDAVQPMRGRVEPEIVQVGPNAKREVAS